MNQFEGIKHEMTTEVKVSQQQPTNPAYQDKLYSTLLLAFVKFSELKQNLTAFDVLPSKLSSKNKRGHRCK